MSMKVLHVYLIGENWAKFADFQEDDFKEADANKDGRVSLTDLQTYMQKYEGSKDKTVPMMIVKHILARDDTNGDGYLEKEGM